MAKINALDFGNYVKESRKTLKDILQLNEVPIMENDSLGTLVNQVNMIPKNIYIDGEAGSYIENPWEDNSVCKAIQTKFDEVMSKYEDPDSLSCVGILLNADDDEILFKTASKNYVVPNSKIYLSDGTIIDGLTYEGYTHVWDKTKDINDASFGKVRWFVIEVPFDQLNPGYGNPYDSPEYLLTKQVIKHNSKNLAFISNSDGSRYTSHAYTLYSNENNRFLEYVYFKRNNCKNILAIMSQPVGYVYLKEIRTLDNTDLEKVFTDVDSINTPNLKLLPNIYYETKDGGKANTSLYINLYYPKVNNVVINIADDIIYNNINCGYGSNSLRHMRAFRNSTGQLILIGPTTNIRIDDAALVELTHVPKKDFYVNGKINTLKLNLQGNPTICVINSDSYGNGVIENLQIVKNWDIPIKTQASILLGMDALLNIVNNVKDLTGESSLTLTLSNAITTYVQNTPIILDGEKYRLAKNSETGTTTVLEALNNKNWTISFVGN